MNIRAAALLVALIVLALSVPALQPSAERSSF